LPNLLVDRRDQKFVLNEMFKIDTLTRYSLFADTAGYDMALDEAHRFAEKELIPTTEAGDVEGCLFDPKKHAVTLPKSYKVPFENLRQGSWMTMCDSPDVGGDGFPQTLGSAVSEVFYAAGFYLYGGVEITHAAAKVIEIFGSSQQKKIFMRRLYDLSWTGTMCLTEPEAGSDVGAIATEAVLLPDDTYAISGGKIFITMGDHDLTENIVHMVLARIKGDPPGPKGLSLFIVPKYLVNEQGDITTRNGVYCTGIEHKMGLNGMVTCTLAFGDKETCTGYLLGKQGRGIMEMFHMMNEQRLLVGLEGLSFSSCAYLNAVDYAHKRKQGKDAVDPRKQVAIIEHPDIKRMLLTMKAYVEGCRAMAYYASFCLDNAHATAESGEQDQSSQWQQLVDILIPIVKAYNTSLSWEVTGMAMQCAGGYGYCKDYPFERLARDCKVTAIFEGANGIQSIDLVFRKILQDKRQAFDHLVERINQTVKKAEKSPLTAPYAQTLATAADRLSQVVDHFSDIVAKGQIKDVYARTMPFLEAMGEVLLGWMHLWQMTICIRSLGEYTADFDNDKIDEIIKKKKEAAFYYGKILSGRFYIDTMLQQTMGKLQGITADADPILRVSKRALAG